MKRTELIRGLKNLKLKHRGCVLTIGNFDGCHRGHQAVLAKTVREARAKSLMSMAIVFEPQPAEFFSRGNPQVRLSRLREKYAALSAAGIDYILCLRFNDDIATLTAEAFIETILVKQLAARHVVIGDDFRFGKNRSGDIHLLLQKGHEWGFTVESKISFLHHDTIRVSSTLVRQTLAAGDLTLASQLLGRPFSLVGRVGYGQQLGRTIGVPTANLFLYREVAPIQGIYVVRVYGLESEPLWGVASIGTRPTVEEQGKPLLEVHILDFEQNIYGRTLRVDFIHKLRDEKRFISFEALKVQIFQDIAMTRKIIVLPQFTA